MDDPIFNAWDNGQPMPRLRTSRLRVVSEQNYLPGMAPAGLPLVYFNDIQPSLDANDFVEGLLVRGSAVIVYGESNSGKTFWMTDLALHVAAGKEWNGRAVEQMGVVYCVLEGGMGFHNRIAAWRNEHLEPGQSIPFAAIPAVIDLLNPDADTRPLIEAIRAAEAALGVKVGLVIIDTVSRAMAGGDENSSEDMTSFVRNVDRIRAEVEACVAGIHHAGKDLSRGARGHSSLRAAVDTEIEIVAEEDGASVSRRAVVVKQRELPKGSIFDFALRVVELGTNARGKPVTSCIVDNPGGEASAGAALSHRRLSKHQQRALEVLADLVAEAGRGGFAGTPAGIPSIPEGWWRQRFYERAMPGEEQDTKKKAFGRAADALIASHLVGMSAGRVWVVSHKP